MVKLNIKNLQCVIMAGGLGSRLGQITKKIPKPLIHINGKPFLHFLLENLILSGIENFLIIVSYKKNKIINYVNKEFRNRVNIKFCYDKNRTGTFNAIIKSKKNLEKEFLYCNSDEIINVDLKKFYVEFKKKRLGALCTIIKNDNGYLVCDKKRKIIKEYSLKKGDYIETGLKIINKNILNNKIKHKKIENFLYRNLINKKDLGYFKIFKMPLRIDTPKDLNNARKNLYFKI